MDSKKRDEIIRKIQKLKKINPNNANEHEVAIAASQVNKLLAKYQLEMADIAEEKVGEGIEVFEYGGGRQKKTWLAQLIFNIAHAYDCRMVIQKNWDSCHYEIMGHKSDIECVMYLVDILKDKLRKMGKAEGKKRGLSGNELTGYVNGYVMGASKTIRERIVADKQHGAIEERGLVVMKSKKVDEQFKQRYTNLSSSRSRMSAIASAGERQGVIDGQRVTLNKGVGTSQAAGQVQ